MSIAPPSPVAITLFVAAVAYVIFHIGAVHFGSFGPRRGWWRRLWAIPWMMGVPLILSASLPLPSFAALGLNLNDLGTSLIATAATLAVMLPLIALQSKNASFRRFYPEVRLDTWTRRDHATNAATWTVYLFVYEFFFRGFLLFTLASTMEPMLALAIVTMAYVFAHIDKNPGELAGTLISGTGFGLAALGTGSILMPWLAHVGIAVSTDFFASRRGPRAPAPCLVPPGL